MPPFTGAPASDCDGSFSSGSSRGVLARATGDDTENDEKQKPERWNASGWEAAMFEHRGMLTREIVCGPHETMSERFDGTLFGPGQPCFGCAPDHPIGFHLVFERAAGDPGEVVTRMTPGERYQGPPGIMHGGLVATLADELASWACIIIAGKFGFTVSFSARLQQAVRIDKEVVGRARIVKPGARFTDVGVTLFQDAQACFSGEFRFLFLDKRGAEKMLGRPLPDGWSKFAR